MSKVLEKIEKTFFETVEGKKDALNQVKEERKELAEGLALLRTPRRFVYKRQGKDGKVFSYVPGGYVIRALNVLFGSTWSFRVEVVEVSEKRAVVKGSLRVGNVVREDFGMKENVISSKTGQPVFSVGDLLKSAATDALKRCARQFGLFLDLWIQEEKQEIKKETNLGKEIAQEVEFDMFRDFVRTVIREGDIEGMKKALEQVNERLLKEGNQDRVNTLKTMKVFLERSLNKIKNK